MEPSIITKGRYKYVHDVKIGPPEAIDVHHICVSRRESVIIFPAFGVQLQTVYRSGRTLRRFVPIGKILKPVLNECVTPVTCYWSLSLILRGEEELLLVFKGLYPPVAMLVPIWKALCAAIDDKECTDMHSDCETG